MPRGQRKITGDLIEHKSGLLIRKDTCDIYVPGHQNQYADMDLSDAVVFDLGAHIGAFTKYAIEQGAKFVVAVEPYLPNADLYRLNMQHIGVSSDKYILYEAAVVNSARKASLFISNSDTSAHSMTSIRGRTEIPVRTIYFTGLLKEYRPHVIKMDIEGSEYDLMQVIPLMAELQVEFVAAELHLNLKDWRDKGREFVRLMSEYYVPRREAIITDTNWNVTGVWELRD